MAVSPVGVRPLQQLPQSRPTKTDKALSEITFAAGGTVTARLALASMNAAEAGRDVNLARFSRGKATVGLTLVSGVAHGYGAVRRFRQGHNEAGVLHATAALAAASTLIFAATGRMGRIAESAMLAGPFCSIGVMLLDK